jgi:hypothetical protein
VSPPTRKSWWPPAKPPVAGTPVAPPVVPTPTPPPPSDPWPISFNAIEEAAAYILAQGRASREAPPPPSEPSVPAGSVARQIVDAGRRARGEIK